MHSNREELVLSRLATVIERNRRREQKQDFSRQMRHAMTGIMIRPRAPDPRKWWNTPEAERAKFDAWWYASLNGQWR